MAFNSKNFVKSAGFLFLLVLLCTAPSSTMALDTKPVLSLDVATKMASACLSHQQSVKYAEINVAIVDDGGNLIAFMRQNAACKACGDIAMSKAKTAVMFGETTRHFELLSYGPQKDGIDADLPGIALVPGLIAFPGGLPIMSKSGQLLGGIGVSGASGDEDEQCAQAAIDAVKDLL